MVVKKKIVLFPQDKKAEEQYYSDASICPFCKDNRKVRAIANNNFSGWSPHVDYKQTVYYECALCRCKWKVKPFKNKTKRNKENNNDI